MPTQKQVVSSLAREDVVVNEAEMLVACQGDVVLLSYALLQVCGPGSCSRRCRVSTSCACLFIRRARSHMELYKAVHESALIYPSSLPHSANCHSLRLGFSHISRLTKLAREHGGEGCELGLAGVFFTETTTLLVSSLLVSSSFLDSPTPPPKHDQEHELLSFLLVLPASHVYHGGQC